ncbi:MAG TPA: glycosyltransferase family 4 protein [Rhizomicrobium sp.]|jgi:glycosyltransferase involved in cell wall biosynthesis|nr:glycosyltransferase family 4 protein [Rhizomicrobium sp.]
MSSLPAILQIVPALDAGGVERTTIDIAQALTQAGFAAFVVSEGGRMEPSLAEAGGELISLQAASKAPHTIVANAFALARVARERGVKLIHARSRAPAWSGLMAARMAGVPFVTTYHGIYNASNPLKRFYNSVMTRADAVIANSQWTAAHVLAEHKIDPAKLTVIPRGVDLGRFDPAGASPDRVAELRAEWGAAPDDFVALLPGRLTRWKGQRVLIDALAKLAHDNRLANIRAVLIGDAQGRAAYEAELRNAISAADLGGKVRIAGHTDGMPLAYLAADVVVSASTDPEAFGRVAAEAGAMGRPVIATDHGGARETVVEGISGLLTAPGDALALADAIARLAAMDAATLSHMGSAGRAHIVERYSLERMCADTIALYRKLISARRVA